MIDGIVFFYVKDDILYPVAMTESEFNLCRNMVSGVFQEDNKLKVLTDNPMGELENVGGNCCEICGSNDGYDCRTCTRSEDPDEGKPLQDH